MRTNSPQTARTTTVFIILLFLLIPFGAEAQEKGKYADAFLSNGIGARALGLGGAYSAIAGDAAAVYWNPAGLSRVNYPEFTLLHAQEFAGVVNYNAFAAAMPYGPDASFGIGLIRLGVDDIPRSRLPRPDLDIGAVYTDEEGRLRRNSPYADYLFSNAEYGLFLSYAKNWSPLLRLGASVKILHKGFDDNSAFGFGVDLGVQSNPWGDLFLGATLQDITTTILAWNTGRKEMIYPTIKIGAGLPLYSKRLQGKVLILADADIDFDNLGIAAQFSGGTLSLNLRAGVEYEYRERLSIRVGSDAGFFTAGAGLRVGLLRIDYAFLNNTDLDVSHRVSASFILEKKRYRRP